MESSEKEYPSTTINGEDQEEEEEEEEEDWLFGGGFLEHSDSDDEDGSLTIEPLLHVYSEEQQDLNNVMKRLGQTPLHHETIDYRERTWIVSTHMGSMASCRGERGEVLREAGAIDGLLVVLNDLKSRLPAMPKDGTASEDTTTMDAIDRAAMELAVACLGALRDLACGSALNRSAVRYFVSKDKTNGLALMAEYLERYHEYSWECIAAHTLHLKLLTNVIGVLRNVTHSTPDNCIELHQHGASSILIWRLLCSSKESTSASLPDNNQPWREASFRAAGTLINMAEKCNDCATLCGSDPLLIHVLVESWGGYRRTMPLIHLGLAAILHAAETELEPSCYDDRWRVILLQEDQRRRLAQRDEEARKQRLLKYQ